MSDDRMAQSPVDADADFRDFIAERGEHTATYADLGVIVDVLFDFAKTQKARIAELEGRVAELQKRPTEIRILRGEAQPSGDPSDREQLTRRIEELETGRLLDRERIRSLESKPHLRYRGVWKSGEEYAPRDCATYHGSLWITSAHVSTEPGVDHASWTLAVKKGRDAR